MNQKVRITACAIALAAGAVFGASRANAETVLNLTDGGLTDSGSINGALFEVNQVQPTGSGVIHSFVRIQTNNAIEQGYNTDGRPLQYDENTSSTFTRSLVLADLQVINKGGVDYYGFLLDINQNNSGPTDHLLNVNDIEVYQGDAPNLLGFTPGSGFGTHSTVVYQMDAGSDNGILLDYNINSGSGSGDMWMFIKKSAFSGTNPYVYLYSKFGVPNANNDGYEEWASVVGHNTPSVPLPASLWGGLTLLGAMGVAKIRSRRRSA